MSKTYTFMIIILLHGCSGTDQIGRGQSEHLIFCRIDCFLDGCECIVDAIDLHI
jgi:hypothetical protein